MWHCVADSELCFRNEWLSSTRCKVTYTCLEIPERGQFRGDNCYASSLFSSRCYGCMATFWYCDGLYHKYKTLPPHPTKIKLICSMSICHSPLIASVVEWTKAMALEARKLNKLGYAGFILLHHSKMDFLLSVCSLMFLHLNWTRDKTIPNFIKNCWVGCHPTWRFNIKITGVLLRCPSWPKLFAIITLSLPFCCRSFSKTFSCPPSVRYVFASTEVQGKPTTPNFHIYDLESGECLRTITQKRQLEHW